MTIYSISGEPLFETTVPARQKLQDALPVEQQESAKETSIIASVASVAIPLIAIGGLAAGMTTFIAAVLVGSAGLAIAGIALGCIGMVAIVFTGTLYPSLFDHVFSCC